MERQPSTPSVRAHPVRLRTSHRRRPPKPTAGASPAATAATETARGRSAAPVVLPLHAHVAAEPKQLIGTLTGVRAVAALWVVVCHFSPALALLFPWFQSLWGITWGGYLGVDLFFVLSGFILTHTYLEQSREPLTLKSYGRFVWLRLARIYPLHVATLLFLAVAVAVATWQGFELNMIERFGLADFVRNLLMIHAWGYGNDISWNLPAWSVSTEWAAYLLFPLMLPFILKVRTRFAVVAVSTVMYAVLLGYFGFIGYSSTTLPNDGAIVRMLTQFVVGCVLYRFYQITPAKPWVWQVITYACGAGILGYLLVFPATEYTTLWPAPLCAVLVLALARANGPVAGFLASPMMLFWGEASYALYMTHDIWRLILTKLLPAAEFADDSLAVRLGVLAVYATFIFGTAAATYVLLERPARRWMRRMIEPPTPKPAGTRIPHSRPRPVAA